MARKTNLKGPVKLSKTISDSLERVEEFGKQFEDDSMEGNAWERYIGASREYEEAFARLQAMGDKPKDKGAYDRQLREVDRRQRIMFSTFDAFQASTRNTITVADADLSAVIVEALSGNLDALPDYQALSGLERHNEFKRVAIDIIEDWKSRNMKIHEDDTLDAPYCDDCEKELAA